MHRTNLFVWLHNERQSLGLTAVTQMSAHCRLQYCRTWAISRLGRNRSGLDLSSTKLHRNVWRIKYITELSRSGIIDETDDEDMKSRSELLCCCVARPCYYIGATTAQFSLNCKSVYCNQRARSEALGERLWVKIHPVLRGPNNLKPPFFFNIFINDTFSNSKYR